MTKSVQEMMRGESMDVGGKSQSMAQGYVDEGDGRVPKTRK